jgi:hypothetical protein
MSKKKSAAPPKSSGSSKTSSWLDATSTMPIIEEQARHLHSFLEAVADGKIDARELKSQEERLVKLIKEVEPLLDEQQHEKVTQLLYELTAYNLMQVMHSMHEKRPKSVFRG